MSRWTGVSSIATSYLRRPNGRSQKGPGWLCSPPPGGLPDGWFTDDGPPGSAPPRGDRSGRGGGGCRRDPSDRNGPPPVLGCAAALGGADAFWRGVAAGRDAGRCARACSPPLQVEDPADPDEAGPDEAGPDEPG